MTSPLALRTAALRALRVDNHAWSAHVHASIVVQGSKYPVIQSEQPSTATPMGPRGPLLQKKLAGTKVPAKFEQGGFTSGRREGPQTLFPGTSPGNLHRQGHRQKLAASKRMLKMEHFSADYHPEFLLARLQKLQRS